MDAIDKLISPLKPLVQQITLRLPAPILQIPLSLIGEKCTVSLLHNLDFSTSNAPCVKLGVSKGLGIGIIAASSIVKVPQLIKLLRSKSATGLSISSYLLETISFLITLAYSIRSGFPFSTYGETALISVQNIVIGALILHYSGNSIGAASFIAAIGTLIYVLLGPSDMVDAGLMRNLQAGAGALGVAAKVPQIWTIYKEGTTGQLSAFAVFNFLLGSLARVFTTLQEISDPIILYGYIVGFALNAVLAFQMIYYWNASPNKVTSKNPLPYDKTTTSSNASAERKSALSHINPNNSSGGTSGGISNTTSGSTAGAYATDVHNEGIKHIEENLGADGQVKSGPWPGPGWTTQAGSTTGAKTGGTTTRRRG